MHSELGSISQAGFVDPKTGDKVRPKSYPHTIQQILDESSRYGFTVAEAFQERAVDEKNCPQLWFLGEQMDKH